MSKLMTLWITSSIAVFLILFLPFSLFATLQLGMGWGLLGVLFVSAIFGFYYCTSTTTPNGDWSSSFSDAGVGDGDTF